MKRFAVAAMLVLCLACGDDTVDRARWQAMPPDDKLMYVQTLIGEAQAKNAKGGSAPRYDQPVNQYAARIDEAYARGDERPVNEIFAGLAAAP